MSKIASTKNHHKTKHKTRQKPKTFLKNLKCLAILLVVATSSTAQTLISPTIQVAQAANNADCPDVDIIFARGSGDDPDNDKDTIEFFSALKDKLYAGYDTPADSDIKYKFTPLQYDAIPTEATSVLGALKLKLSGGTAYDFSLTVNPLEPGMGFDALMAAKGNSACPKTKYVLAGFGQGAFLMNRALSQIETYDIIYVALFSDPMIHLPEGEGPDPDACHGRNLSDYRMHVPDCHAYEGFIGAMKPYVPSNLEGRLGTWCNGYDYYCSSKFGYKDHFTYAESGIYEDASRVIYDKIMAALDRPNTYTSPHDTAILIDSTHSMIGLINSYKSEIIRLARRTLESGGRIALYDYRDLITGYHPVKHCDFGTCTLELFRSELNSITTDPKGNGDDPESLLSAAFTAMNDLDWRYGATKSIVTVTNATYLNPDRSPYNTTFEQVVTLSKSIDPVNFYIVTNNPIVAADYQALVDATDGMVVDNVNEASALTNFVMARYDSLPRVDESTATLSPLAEIISDEELAALQAKLLAEPEAESEPRPEITPIIPKAPNTGRL